ncbi:hypothetical protein KP509_37G051100 [Ceratopteris richardii]|uniref:Uncharacterized protein n=1 Tax=Ceratopteris richardii TaxID=49495 RepID=A0A8T2Q8V0_CERRI|nr:hypothetical protein KP509_37G051100 [Ceratopteris richardii]
MKPATVEYLIEARETERLLQRLLNISSKPGRLSACSSCWSHVYGSASLTLPWRFECLDGTMMNLGASGADGSNISPSLASVGGVGRSLSTPSPSFPSTANFNSSFQRAAQDSLLEHLAEDLAFTHDGKLETQQALMEELLESLSKEEKMLDNDAWKYAAPRSQLHLTSMLGVRMGKEGLLLLETNKFGESNTWTCFMWVSSRIAKESKEEKKASSFWRSLYFWTMQ